MTLMAARKRVSISMEQRVLDLAREAAAAEGKSLSAWLNDTAEHAARIQAGLREVAEFEAEHGAFTADEIRRADEALDRMGIRRPR